MSTWITEIRHLLSEAELEKAFRIFKKNNQDKKIANDLIILEGRWNILKKNEFKGLISSENAGVENATIREAILNLLPESVPTIEQHDSKDQGQANNEPITEKVDPKDQAQADTKPIVEKKDFSPITK